MNKFIPKRSTVPPSVRLALDWLVGSGIQNVSRDTRLKGGVAAWYEMEGEIYPFLYSEITGYALTGFAFLYRLTKDARLVKASALAKNWLLRHAINADGGVKTRFYLVKDYVSPNYCFHRGRVYAFDAAMVGYGLLQHFKMTGESDALEAAGRVLDFLSKRMARKDGLFHAYCDTSSGRCGEDLEKWSDQSGTFHGKLALFFIDHHRTTGLASSGDSAKRLLDAVCALQEKDGRFITGRKDKSTHLHPHAYTLEGLVYGAVHLGRRKWIDAALEGFLWMTRGVSSDGSVSSFYVPGSFSHHERSDIVAQTLRLGSILYSLRPGSMRTQLDLLRRVRNHLLLFQYRGGDGQNGGFLYGSATDGLLRVHLNAWSTLFAAQALWMYEEFVEKKRPLKLEALI